MPRITREGAIEAIASAGGVSVLAHPYQTGYNDVELEAEVSRLKECGLGGLECYYSMHSPERTAFYLGLARKYDLAVTGGSDFHGLNKTHIALGVGRGDLSVSDSLLSALEARCPRLPVSGMAGTVPPNVLQRCLVPKI